MNQHPLSRALAWLIRGRAPAADSADAAAKMELTIASLTSVQRSKLQSEGERAVAEVLRHVAERDAAQGRAAGAGESAIRPVM
jgi:hypothetical protein